ncbi:MAG: CBS domain-containing protein [Nocardioides sp.]
MLVREVMSTSPVTVGPGTTLQEALRLVAGAHITSLPVVDAEGRLRGIVSEADLIKDRVPSDPRLNEHGHVGDLPGRHEHVEDVMTPYVVAVGPDDDLVHAVETMTSTTVKSLPVVDRAGRVVGMLSRSDVVRVLAGSDDELHRDIDLALSRIGLRDWLVEVHDGAVDLTGPREDDSELARVAAATVPGVASVCVRWD